MRIDQEEEQANQEKYVTCAFDCTNLTSTQWLRNSDVTFKGHCDSYPNTEKRKNKGNYWFVLNV